MGFGGSKPAPLPVQMPPPAAHPPTLASASVAASQQAAKERAKAAEGMGMDNTVKTGSQGLVAPATATTTLLGG
jgi:hypothetical protein